MDIEREIHQTRFSKIEKFKEPKYIVMSENAYYELKFVLSEYSNINIEGELIEYHNMKVLKTDELKGRKFIII